MRLALRPGLNFLAAGADSVLLLDLAGEQLLRGAPFAPLLNVWREGMTVDALHQALQGRMSFGVLVGALRHLEQAGVLCLEAAAEPREASLQAPVWNAPQQVGEDRWVLGVQESLAGRVPVPPGERMLLVDDPRRAGVRQCLEHLCAEGRPVRVVVLGTPWALVGAVNDVAGLDRLISALWECAPLSYARQGHEQGLLALPPAPLRELPPGLSACLADPPARWWRCEQRSGGAPVWPDASAPRLPDPPPSVLQVPGPTPADPAASLDLATSLEAFEPLADERLEPLAMPLVGIARDLRLSWDAQGRCHAAAHPALPMAALNAAGPRGLIVPGCAGTGLDEAAARRICLAEVAERRSVSWHGDEGEALTALRLPGCDTETVDAAAYLLAHPRSVGAADTTGCAVAGTFSAAVVAGLFEAVEREALWRWREAGEAPIAWLEPDRCLQLAAPGGLAVVAAMEPADADGVYLGVACRASLAAARSRALAELAQQRFFGVRDSSLGALPERAAVSPKQDGYPVAENLEQLLNALAAEDYGVRLFNLGRAALGIPCARVELLRAV